MSNVKEYLEKRHTNLGKEKGETILFDALSISNRTGLSLWKVKKQLRNLRIMGIVGYKWFEDNANYCPCYEHECECEQVPFGNGYWSWYFNNWHNDNRGYE